MKARICIILACAAALSLMTAGLATALTKRTLTDTFGEAGSISMKVEINKGEVKRFKAIQIKNMAYTCESETAVGGVEFKTITATLKGPYKATHINGHPNLFKKMKVGNVTVGVGLNMPNEQGKKAIGTIGVDGTSDSGGTCIGRRNFVAK